MALITIQNCITLKTYLETKSTFPFHPEYQVQHLSNREKKVNKYFNPENFNIEQKSRSLILLH